MAVKWRPQYGISDAENQNLSHVLALPGWLALPSWLALLDLLLRFADVSCGLVLAYLWRLA